MRNSQVRLESEALAVAKWRRLGDNEIKIKWF